MTEHQAKIADLSYQHIEQVAQKNKFVEYQRYIRRGVFDNEETNKRILTDLASWIDRVLGWKINDSYKSIAFINNAMANELAAQKSLGEFDKMKKSLMAEIDRQCK